MVTSASGSQITLDWATPNESGGVGTTYNKRKTADEAVVGTTLQNDDHLSIAVAANRAYENTWDTLL